MNYFKVVKGEECPKGHHSILGDNGKTLEMDKDCFMIPENEHLFYKKQIDSLVAMKWFKYEKNVVEVSEKDMKKGSDSKDKSEHKDKKDKK